MDVNESNTMIDEVMLPDSSIEINQSKELKLLKYLKTLLPTALKMSEVMEITLILDVSAQ